MENQPADEPEPGDANPTRGLSPSDPNSHYIDFSGDARSRYDRSPEKARQRAMGLRIKLDIQAAIWR